MKSGKFCFLNTSITNYFCIYILCLFLYSLIYLYSLIQLDFKETDFFSNILQDWKWATKHSLKKLREPVDRTKWYMTPPTVNAYYEPTENEIGEFVHYVINLTQSTHDVRATFLRRHFSVLTSFQRPFNVVLTSIQRRSNVVLRQESYTFFSFLLTPSPKLFQPMPLIFGTYQSITKWNFFQQEVDVTQ